MSYTNSRTWRSEQQIILGEWKRISTALMHMRLDRSPFIPHNVNDYVKHRAEYAAMAAEEARTRAERMELDAYFAEKQGRSPLCPYIKKGTSVELLCSTDRPSIWKPTWKPTEEHPLAPWPGQGEFKEEGDERHTSGFGRFLPIPRVPGNPTVVWKQRNFIAMYEMDMVHPVPKRYDVELPGDYGRPEPMTDENGIYIDDDGESGKTSYVNASESMTLSPSVFSGELVLHHTSSTNTSPISPQSLSLAEFGVEGFLG